MSLFLKDLYKKKLITPPKFLLDNTIYLTMVGSVAYGVNSDTSDEDLVGVCIPPKDIIFPHTAGEILGFDTKTKRFEQYQQHHIIYSDIKEYDITIYNIIKYFRLCANNNPNMLDSLFVPDFCIKHINPIGMMIRENRKLFLSKKAWHTFKGYAYSTIVKLDTKNKNDYTLLEFESKHNVNNNLEEVLEEVERRK